MSLCCLSVTVAKIKSYGSVRSKRRGSIRLRHSARSWARARHVVKSVEMLRRVRALLIVRPMVIAGAPRGRLAGTQLVSSMRGVRVIGMRGDVDTHHRRA